MNNKTITARVHINNLPLKPLGKGYLVARQDITVGHAELWYYGLYETPERAAEVAYKIRNGVVLEVDDE